MKDYIMKPGADAVSVPSSLSSTPHSISRPRTNSSTRILRSCRNASATACANSSRVPALLMPTDEPSRAGFTNTGRPSSETIASKVGASPRLKLIKRGIGRPRSRIRRLAMSLSIAAADPNTPDPTYATPAISAKPCTVPSSPNGPCRTGKTTSTASDKSGGTPSFSGMTMSRPEPPGTRAARGPLSGTAAGNAPS